MCTCNHCSSFVASSDGHPISRSVQYGILVKKLPLHLITQPSLDEIRSYRSPTIFFVPTRAKSAYARVLSSVLEKVIADNSVASWLKLMVFP